MAASSVRTRLLHATPRALAAAIFATLLVAAACGTDAIVVETERPRRQDTFRSTVTASGEIVAARYADIGSSVMGRIVSLPVREGDRVAAGQVLARIDAIPARSDVAGAAAQVAALEAEMRAAAEQVAAARADLAAAEARAADATRQATRLEELHRQGIVAAAERDAARAQAEAATAQIAAARAAIDRAHEAKAAAERRVAQARAQQMRAADALAKTDITSPIDGIVSRLRVREGEMVVIGLQNQPGTTLMTVSDLSRIDAEVKVAEADVLRVMTGQRAVVTLDAVPGRRFPATVVEIGASALPVVGTVATAREFRVLVRLDDADPALRPGLTCDAEITTSERTGVLTVPLQSVVLRPGSDGSERTGVFVVSNGRVAFTPVTTGVIGGLAIEVSGVDERAEVVVGPFQVLRTLEDGASVRATSAR